MGASLVYLEKPDKTKHSETSSNTHITYGATHMQGWRQNMEDAHIAQITIDQNEKQSLIGVMDGHGGKEVAIYVQRHFKKLLQKNEDFKQKDYSTALRDTFIELDKQIDSDMGKKELKIIQKVYPNTKSKLNNSLQSVLTKENQETDDQPQESVGCTCNILYIDNENKKIYCANAGDSRSVMCIGGKAVELSFDHKPDDEIEYNRITRAGSQVAQGRIDGGLNLSRALGDYKYKRNKTLNFDEQSVSPVPDVTVNDLSDDIEFIICACDGIWENKQSQEIIDFIHQKIQKNGDDNLNGIIEELFEDIISPDYTKTQGLGCDNMTCVLIKFNKNGTIKVGEKDENKENKQEQSNEQTTNQLIENSD